MIPSFRLCGSWRKSGEIFSSLIFSEFFSEFRLSKVGGFTHLYTTNVKGKRISRLFSGPPWAVESELDVRKPWAQNQKRIFAAGWIAQRIFHSAENPRTATDP